MARWKSGRRAGPTLRDYFHERAATAVRDADAAIASGAPDRYDGALYPWAELHEIDSARSRARVAALDAGNAITVSLWELPQGTGIPAYANQYTLHPDSSLSVLEMAGGRP